MPLLIDPPVGPFSSPAELEAWLKELREMRTRYADDPQAIEAIADAEAQANEWLLDRAPA